MRDPITRYRVYIKKKKRNILDSTVNGNKLYPFVEGILEASDGSANTTERWNNSVITTEYIPVDQKHSYVFKKIGRAIYKGYICEYDQNKNYIYRSGTGSISYEVNYSSAPLKKAIPYTPSENAKYIRLMFESSVSDKDRITMLENSQAVLIHDSGSPNKEDHLLNITLHVEDSSAGYLEFIMTSFNPYFKNKINLWTDTVYVTRTYKDGSERIYWDGRPISEQIDSDGNRSYHCEGALSYLNDMRVDRISGREYQGTAFQFIMDRILSEKNDDSILCDCLDRTFYHYKENGEPVEGASIFVDQGVQYTWVSNYESGLKWLSDISESFGGHYKIRYREYDSPTDDIICRSFAMIQDFNRKIQIQPYTRKLIGTNIKKDSLFFVKKGNNPRVHKAKVNFYVANNLAYNNFLDINKGYSEILNADESIEIIDGSTAYQYLEKGRFSKLNAIFGENVFSVQKVREIENFATRIIPKGASCYNSYGDSTNIYMSTTSIYTDGENNKKNFTAYYDSDYLEDISLIKYYGLVTAVVSFENADTPKALRKMAIEWFKNLKKAIVRTSIEISLSNLKQSLTLTDQNDPFTDPEYVDIWTFISAEIPQFDITADNPEEYFVSAMDIPLDDYLNTSVTLINTKELITDNVISAGDIKGSTEGIIDTSS